MRVTTREIVAGLVCAVALGYGAWQHLHAAQLARENDALRGTSLAAMGPLSDASDALGTGAPATAEAVGRPLMGAAAMLVLPAIQVTPEPGQLDALTFSGLCAVLDRMDRFFPTNGQSAAANEMNELFRKRLQLAVPAVREESAKRAARLGDHHRCDVAGRRG